MINSYQCPNCKNYYSEQVFTSHYTNCKSPSQQYTTQVYNTSPTTNIDTYTTQVYNTTPTANIDTYTTQAYDTNGFKNTNTYINNPSNYLNNYKTSSNTVYVSNPTPIKTQNTNILFPQQKRVITTVQNQPFRPQTITYFNPILNQTNNYSGLNQNQINNNLSNIGTLKYETNKNPIYANNNKNLNTNTNINSSYICKICKKEIPTKEQKDHILSHKLEQEEKDRIQAQTLQDEDLFENLPPEQIEQQRKIEEYIRRQRTQRQNNNNNNNFMNNDFNINENMGNLGRMNMNGFPNIIIRRTTTTNNNNDLNNLSSGMGSPGFFENFFNGNMNLNNDFMNMPSGGMRRIIIPMGMGAMGNMGGMGQNNLNELIERMLHYRRDNPTDAAIVSELPETKIDDINKLDNDKKSCVICMEDFKNGDVSTNLPCLHMFHTNCIQSWLKTQNTCPICKFQLTQDNINNINNNNPS